MWISPLIKRRRATIGSSQLSFDNANETAVQTTQKRLNPYVKGHIQPSCIMHNTGHVKEKDEYRIGKEPKDGDGKRH